MRTINFYLSRELSPILIKKKEDMTICRDTVMEYCNTREVKWNEGVFYSALNGEKPTDGAQASPKNEIIENKDRRGAFNLVFTREFDGNRRIQSGSEF